MPSPAGPGQHRGAQPGGGLGGEFLLRDAVDGAHPFGGQRGRRAVEDHLAGLHGDDAVAVLAGGVEVVQVHQHGQPVLAVHVAQRIHHHLGIARVERGDRLIRQDQPRLLHQGAADGDALLLPAREGLGPLQRGIGQAEAVERGQRHGPLRGGEAGADQHHERAPAALVGQPADQHVGQHVQPLHQVELLEDHGAVAPPVAQGPAVERGHVPPAREDAAGARRLQPVDQPQQGRFARARAADDADHLAVRHLEVHVVHREGGPELPRQPLQFQHPVPAHPGGDMLSPGRRRVHRFRPQDRRRRSLASSRRMSTRNWNWAWLTER